MTDLSITPANVVAGSGATRETGTAGDTITAGKVVYKDTSTTPPKFKLADSNSGTAAVRQPIGIALHGAADGQPLTILKAGPITIGASVTPGTDYYLSDTAGGICPRADVGSGEDVCLIGLATSATVIDVDIQNTGVTL